MGEATIVIWRPLATACPFMGHLLSLTAISLFAGDSAIRSCHVPPSDATDLCRPRSRWIVDYLFGKEKAKAYKGKLAKKASDVSSK